MAPKSLRCRIHLATPRAENTCSVSCSRRYRGLGNNKRHRRNCGRGRLCSKAQGRHRLQLCIKADKTQTTQKSTSYMQFSNYVRQERLFLPPDGLINGTKRLEVVPRPSANESRVLHFPLVLVLLLENHLHGGTETSDEASSGAIRARGKTKQELTSTLLSGFRGTKGPFNAKHPCVASGTLSLSHRQ